MRWDRGRVRERELGGQWSMGGRGGMGEMDGERQKGGRVRDQRVEE